MFACRNATLLITEEREGALTGMERAKFRFHMTICGHCKAYRRQLDLAMRMAKEISEDSHEAVPASVEERALEAFRARGKRSG